MESSHRGLRRVAALALEVVASKSETQGHLSGCEGAIPSHLVFFSPDSRDNTILYYTILYYNATTFLCRKLTFIKEEMKILFTAAAVILLSLGSSNVKMKINIKTNICTLVQDTVL